MAPQKTQAIILKISDFRESSGILYCLTPDHGLVHCIAKGIRRKKTGSPSMERGFLVETMLYCKPNREMHTLGDMDVVEYFPSIRKDLFKNIIRDIVFEVIIKTMSCDFPHPEVFRYCAEFFKAMDQSASQECFPDFLLKFFYEFCRLMGVAPNIDNCVNCGHTLVNRNGGYLRLENGSMCCTECTLFETQPQRFFVPGFVLELLRNTTHTPLCSVEAARLIPSETRRIIWLFAGYCQYHFHHATEFRSLSFLDSILPHSAPVVIYDHA